MEPLAIMELLEIRENDGPGLSAGFEVIAIHPFPFTFPGKDRFVVAMFLGGVIRDYCQDRATNSPE
jgi:hypothetical protein